MARLDIENGRVTGIHGKISGNDYVQMRNGKLITCRMPSKPNKPPTANQLAHQERFRKANSITNRILSEPVLRGYFEYLKHEDDYGHLWPTLRGYIFSEIISYLQYEV